jgi:hypothetical protein
MTVITRVSRRGKSTPTYSHNPFVAAAIAGSKPKMKRVTNGSNRLMILAEDTGEIVGPAGFWVGKEVDRAQFIKLYINGVKAFRDLTATGTRVFEVLYLQMQANPGRDRITLSFLRIDQPITPMSQKTYHRGMRELLDKRFIAESVVPGDYFVNPDYLFNGDRLAFVQQFQLRITAVATTQ